MIAMKRLVTQMVLVGCGFGCTNNFEVLNLEEVFPSGEPFVLKGTADLVDNGGPCRIWRGENGIIYHLFQSPQVDNETFDQVTAPGTTSRVQISVRDDLEVTCQLGPTVIVEAVLEIVE